MKSWAGWALLPVRLAIGGLFIYSGFSKLIQPQGYFEYIVGMYDLGPEWAVSIAATAIPWVELICGTFLAVGYMTRTSAASLLALVGLFQYVLAQAIFRKLQIRECGCFTDLHLSPSQTYILDSQLFLILLALTFSNWHAGTLDQALSKTK